MIRLKLAILSALFCATGWSVEQSSVLTKNLANWSENQPIAANSEQRFPLFIGTRPFGPAQKNSFEFLDEYKKNIEQALAKYFSEKNVTYAEFEIYPAKSEDVAPIMVIARQKIMQGNWQFAWEKDMPEIDGARFVKIFDPTKSKKDRNMLFTDFEKAHGLYDKPLAGDCIFLNRHTNKPIVRWSMDLDWLKKKSLKEKLICAYLPRPPYLNLAPKTFTLLYKNNKFIWPELFEFISRDYVPSFNKIKTPKLKSEPREMEELSANYKHWVDILTAEKKDPDFPKFTRKNSAQKNNHLEAMANYFEKNYSSLGLKVRRQKFSWRGISQENLIAIQPGIEEGVVIVADHYDAAFSEDIYQESGKRVSTPGADDNISATAGLLALAKSFEGMPLKKTIWYVHLTGEEFPADDLGARELIRLLLKEKINVEGVVVLDMIAYKEKNWPNHFQINMGEGKRSAQIADVFLQNAGGMALSPLVRPRFSERSYLFQTDALIFSDFGLPTILINEWLNGIDNWERPHYHQSTDRVNTLDFDYALKILNVVAKGLCSLACLEKN